MYKYIIHIYGSLCIYTHKISPVIPFLIWCRSLYTHTLIYISYTVENPRGKSVVTMFRNALRWWSHVAWTTWLKPGIRSPTRWFRSAAKKTEWPWCFGGENSEKNIPRSLNRYWINPMNCQDLSDIYPIQFIQMFQRCSQDFVAQPCNPWEPHSCIQCHAPLEEFEGHLNFVNQVVTYREDRVG